MTPDRKSGKMRLNRFLARAGIGSRREVEAIIRAGRVVVNGEIRGELATIVDPEADTVTLDGERVTLPKPLYYKCYKPRGVVSTLDDPQKRDSLGELLASHGIPPGVVSAGRLDRDSEGLLILTNDGELLQRLTHPRHGVQKTYRVLVDRYPPEADLAKARNGVDCGTYVARPVRVTRMGPQPADDENPQAGYWLEIVMVEGRKREIREMLSAVGYRVLRLVRIAHGPIQVGTLKPGEISSLAQSEMERLLENRDL